MRAGDRHWLLRGRKAAVGNRGEQYYSPWVLRFSIDINSCVPGDLLLSGSGESFGRVWRLCDVIACCD